MKYTLGQAAKATGKTKPTISRAIKNGHISAIKNQMGRYEIDPAELHRVYPPLEVVTERKNTERTETEPYVTYDITRELRQEISHLQQRIKDKEELIDEIRTEREEWKAQARSQSQKITALLDDQTANRQSFWSRLFKG